MSTKTLWTVAAACAALMAVGSAMAQEAAKEPAYKASGTHESRSAERKANRAKQAAAEKKGDVAASGDAAKEPGYKASGTHATRKAERKVNRAKQAEAEKKGDVAPSGEAATKK